MCVCAYIYFTDLVILKEKESLENNVDNRNTSQFHECDLLNGAFFYSIVLIFSHNAETF